MLSSDTDIYTILDYSTHWLQAIPKAIFLSCSVMIVVNYHFDLASAYIFAIFPPFN